MRVSIPDDLYDRLKEKYKTPQAVDRAVTSAAESAALRQGRYLVLDAEQIDDLEQLLAGGSLLSSDDLLRKVHHLADLKVGTYVIPLDASDLSRMQQRAHRAGLTVAQYAERMLDRFKDEWLMIGEPQDLVNERAEKVSA